VSDVEEYRHMYVRERMARNLGLGNIGEAFFRDWFRQSVSSPSLTLSQFGYNPEGIIVGEEKVKLLKSLARSPDYCLFKTSDIETDAEKPLLGISVNQQSKGYTMWEARFPPACYTCDRRAQQQCYEKKISNAWFNKYNIDNDYKGFRELFQTDVIMVTLVLRWANSVYQKVKDANLGDALLQFIQDGNPQSSDSVAKTVDIVTREQRRSKEKPSRKYELKWLLYSDVVSGKVPKSVAGAPVSRGQPRKVICVNLEDTRNESELVRYLQNLEA